MTPTNATARHSLERWSLAVFLALLLAFHWFTLRPGHSWGGDFALYILHAKNLAEGRAYSDTPYVYNPAFATHSPQSYPPVFPLLLTPVYAAWGLSYPALKAVGIVSLVVAVGLLYLLSRRFLSFPGALAVAVLVGYNPVYWGMKDEVGPDFPYMAFSFAALFWMDRVYAKGLDRSHAALAAAVAALCFALSYGTRSVGLTLVPAVVLHDVWRNRGISRFAVIYSLLAVGAILGLSALVPSERSYVEQFRLLNASILKGNAVEYVRSFAFTWVNGHFRPFQYLLFVLSLVGCVWAWKEKWRLPEVMDLYFLFYLGLLMIWPGANGVRYILPVIPLFLLYSVQGWIPLASRVAGSRISRLALAAFFAAALLSYAGRYRQLSFGPITDGVAEPEFQELTQFIQTKTDPAGMIYFWNPRVLGLYTGHKSASYSPLVSVEENWSFFQSQKGRFVAVRKLYEDDQRHLIPMLQAHASELRLLYENPRYGLYERTASN